MAPSPSNPLDPAAGAVAAAIAARLAGLPEVVAVAVVGSRAAAASDPAADLDLSVFARPDPPLAARAAIAADLADPGAPIEIGNTTWGPNDEWTHAASGLAVDAMYWAPDWMEDRLARVLVRHEPAIGYSTCFWHSVRSCHPLVDRDGWLARLREQAAAPYPEPLRRAIVAANQPILRDRRSSYLHQIEQALRRGDRVSVNHRAAAFLASYFDLLFALNRQPHPGEKRLVDHALARCPLRPAGFPADLEALLGALPSGDPSAIRAALDRLVDGLDALIAAEGLAVAPPPG